MFKVLLIYCNDLDKSILVESSNPTLSELPGSIFRFPAGSEKDSVT